MIVLTALLCMSTASSKSSSVTQDFNNSTGLVPPTVATNMFRTSNFIQAASGILICRDELSQDGNQCLKDGKNAWKSMANSVPPGKTFVAFRIVSGYGGRMAVEVYWK